MNAQFELFNPRRGMAAARFEGGYVIFEMHDSSVPEVGDIISHPNFLEMGSQDFQNLNQRSKFSVYVENVVPSKAAAIKNIS